MSAPIDWLHRGIFKEQYRKIPVIFLLDKEQRAVSPFGKGFCRGDALFEAVFDDKQPFQPCYCSTRLPNTTAFKKQNSEEAKASKEENSKEENKKKKEEKNI